MNGDQDFATAIKSLSGEKVWSVLASSVTGSSFTLEMGAKLPLTPPLMNPQLTEEERRFEGKFGLYVTCTWRLDDEQTVVCGSDDNSSYTIDMEEGLQRLIGETVIAAHVTRPGYDLILSFSNGLTLRIFCDRTNSKHADNYLFFGPNQIFGVRNQSRVTAETRGGSKNE